MLEDPIDEIATARTVVGDAIERLSEEYENFNWWVPDDMDPFREEFEKELPDGHTLAGIDLAPMAKNDRSDDILFYGGGRFFRVHLTWSRQNSLPFPLFETLEGDITDFLRADYLEEADGNVQPANAIRLNKLLLEAFPEIAGRFGEYTS